MRFRPIIACVCVLPLLTGASEPLRLQPAGPWNVEYAENSCRLTRTFGQGSTLTTFGFESAAPDEMDMLAVGRPLRSNAEQISAKFLPAGSKSFDGMVVTAVHSGTPAILWSSIPMMPADMLARVQREQDERRLHPRVRPPPTPVAEQELRRAQRQQFATAVTELEIQTRPRPVVLETGSLGAAIAAFDKCSRDSLKDWGIDPEIEDKIVRPLWAVDPTDWLSSIDYPDNMVRSGAESDVTLRLLVDSTGKVTKCTSLSHFAEKEFNRISCEKVSHRARFEPAELADGTKVPSYYTFRIKFRLQG